MITESNRPSAELRQLVERFQCPGCVAGSDTRCGSFRFDPGHRRCLGHVLGTIVSSMGTIALGLPKGFCRPGFDVGLNGEAVMRYRMPIRLYLEGDSPGWDRFNVPVWALEKDGFLFVRTFLPRVGLIYVDVIERGTLAMVPQAINVAEFIAEMD